MWAQTQTERQTERQTETDRETDRETERHTHTHTNTHTCTRAFDAVGVQDVREAAIHLERAKLQRQRLVEQHKATFSHGDL